MRTSSIRVTISCALAGGVCASAFLMPEYLRLRAFFNAPPISASARAASTDNAFVTAIALLSAIVLSCGVAALLLVLRPLWAKPLAALPLLFVSPFGSLPIYWYVYRNAAPGAHIHVPDLYRLAPLAAASAAYLVATVAIHVCPLISRRRTDRREA